MVKSQCKPRIRCVSSVSLPVNGGGGSSRLTQALLATLSLNRPYLSTAQLPRSPFARSFLAVRLASFLTALFQVLLTIALKDDEGSP